MSNKQLFRQKSLDKMKSPDHLTEYIRVATPSEWILLLAIAVLLFGVIVWGFWGRLESNVTTVAVSDGNRVICYVPEDQISEIELGQNVTINGNIYQIAKIADQATVTSGDIGSLESGQRIYEVQVGANLPQGIYQAGITTEVIHPAEFVFN